MPTRTPHLPLCVVLVLACCLGYSAAIPRKTFAAQLKRCIKGCRGEITCLRACYNVKPTSETSCNSRVAADMCEAQARCNNVYDEGFVGHKAQCECLRRCKDQHDPQRVQTTLTAEIVPCNDACLQATAALALGDPVCVLEEEATQDCVSAGNARENCQVDYCRNEFAIAERADTWYLVPGPADLILRSGENVDSSFAAGSRVCPPYYVQGVGYSLVASEDALNLDVELFVYDNSLAHALTFRDVIEIECHYSKGSGWTSTRRTVYKGILHGTGDVVSTPVGDQNQFTLTCSGDCYFTAEKLIIPPPPTVAPTEAPTDAPPPVATQQPTEAPTRALRPTQGPTVAVSITKPTSKNGMGERTIVVIVAGIVAAIVILVVSIFIVVIVRRKSKKPFKENLYDSML